MMTNLDLIKENLQFPSDKMKTGLSFQEIFSYEPRPLQALTDEISSDAIPDFTLIEATMGGGKTAAALNLAYHGLEHGKKGILFLMPTNATARSMNATFNKFVSTIVPSYHSRMLGSKNRLVRVAEKGHSDKASDFSYFCTGNAQFLFPFSIMTVDQAMRAVARSKNVTQLLVEMSNKVVIFDEVHNYDPYMMEYIVRLLNWLKVYHAPVIMLSATMATSQKEKLFSVYSDTDLENLLADGHEYPCITTWSQNKAIQQWLPARHERSSKHYHLNCKNVPDLKRVDVMVKDVLDATQKYDTIFVIRNTIKNSVDLYDALKNCVDTSSVRLILFHSMMPEEYKIHRTNFLLNAYGKNGFFGPLPDKPQKSIVIATEVIEQSMDISCDMLFTDLAPITELLQRIGREIRFGNRMDAEVCIWGSDIRKLNEYQARSLIYHRALLDATLQCFFQKNAVQTITVPEMNVEMIEKVERKMQESDYYDDYCEKEEERAQNAKMRLIPSPDQLVCGFFTAGAMSKENEKTRDSDYASVIVILLSEDLWKKYEDKKLQALTEKQKADLIYHFGVTIPSYKMKKIEDIVTEEEIRDVGFAAGLRCYFIKSSDRVYIDQDKGLIYTTE